MTTDLTILLNARIATPRDSDSMVGGLSEDLLLEVGPLGSLAVRLELDDDGSVLATDALTGSYGVGASRNSALQALRDAVLRHYSFLVRTGPDRLSDQLRLQFEVLEARKMALRSDSISLGDRQKVSGNRPLALAA